MYHYPRIFYDVGVPTFMPEYPQATQDPDLRDAMRDNSRDDYLDPTDKAYPGKNRLRVNIYYKTQSTMDNWIVYLDIVSWIDGWNSIPNCRTFGDVFGAA